MSTFRTLFQIMSLMTICVLVFGFLLDIKFITDTSMGRFDRFRELQLLSRQEKTILPVDAPEIIVSNNVIVPAINNSNGSQMENNNNDLQTNIRRNESQSRTRFDNRLPLIPNVIAVDKYGSSRNIVDRLSMPDNPFSYIKNVQDLKKEANNIFLKEENEKIEEIDQNIKYFPKLFKMFQDLQPKQKNKSRLFFDLSNKAKALGKIGPFIEKRKMSKALKSIDTVFGIKNIPLPVESVGDRINALMADLFEEDSENKIEAAIVNQIEMSDSATKTKPAADTLSHYISKDERFLSEEKISEIKLLISDINEQQQISNTDLYGPVTPDTTIILIQVHKRAQYLRLLIASLAAVRHIQRCLVIFSHDFWLPAINQMIGSISDYRTMQLFYPHTLQLHPYTYPGADPRDCRWNHTKIRRSFNLNVRHHQSCLNEDWPDTYGHYREPRFTQIKHHWWWKAFRVFDELNVTRNWSGDVLFLEEDHYVSQDLLHALRLLRGRTQYSHHAILSVGNFSPIKKGTAAMLFTGDWGGRNYNIGYAFNATVWRLIREEAEFFCDFDEYNWDWTLAFLLKKIPSLRSCMLATKMSRVFHLGECGIHGGRSGECDPDATLADLQGLLATMQHELFPAQLAPANPLPVLRLTNVNGGWSDWRDKYLCKAIANQTDTQSTLERLQMRTSKAN